MTDDRLTRNPLGHAGRRVRDNVKTLRLERGLTHQQMADLLADRGRPIPVLGLSRIENGARRVDVDDLMALAAVLGTTPADLLADRAALTIEQYREHQAAIERVDAELRELIKAGVPVRGLIDYLDRALSVRHEGMRPVAPSDIEEWNAASGRKASDDGER